MSRWREVVRRELRRYREQTGYDVVERQEFLDLALPVLRAEFPENNHPAQKVSQVLQQLRDRDEVTFIALGTYRIGTLAGPIAGESDGRAEPGGGQPADTDAFPEYAAEEYETTATARSMPAAFRTAILDRYDHACPVSGVDHDRLLDVAHVLDWSDHPDRRTDPGNVLALDRTHHAAFDAGLFTLDADRRLHVAPDFETKADTLRRTLVARDGERVPMPERATVAGECLEQHNQRLDWW
jgi:putative restriction endonuclease